MKPHLIILTGPTAVGKTDLSIGLAEQYDTEIVSADSRQIYREMTVGTAKPSLEQLDKIKHHFIGNISIHAPFTTGDYFRNCVKLLEDLFSKKDIVILTGGTGLYIKSILEGLDEFPPVPQEIKEHYRIMFQEKGIEALQQEIKIIDPKYALQVDMGNARRLSRALEISKTSAQPYSSFLCKNNYKPFFTYSYFVLNRDRSELYARINQRVDDMMKNGLLTEVKTLEDYHSLPSLQTVGYKELFRFLNNEISLEESIDKIKQHTRNYAKRQLTWFRKVENAVWLDAKKMTISNLLELIEKERKK